MNRIHLAGSTMAGKKTVAKDWYWEAEQDKIAADQDLKLIPSPEGWPSEGLDCVGLWFLMLNLMSRSARRGYLCSPADDRKPMSFDELAVLTGRTKAVVTRLANVILLRGLFSKTEDGIIYSRGMLRKEELRKKRSKSGKKGGLRTRDLLKQIAKQNEQQTLRIRIQNASESFNGDDFAQAKVEAKFDDAARRLAFVYRGAIRGRRPEDESVCVEAFAEMLAMGLSEDLLTAELRKGPPQRDRGEYLWQIKKRLGVGAVNGDANLMGGIAAFAAGGE